jgi:hypothetical protein
MATLRRVTSLEISCIAAWALIIAIDVTLIAADHSFVAHPAHGIALSLAAVVSWYALTLRALRPIRVSLGELRLTLAELRIRQRETVMEITGEMPRPGAVSVRHLAELVEASDRDRDLIAAALRDEIERARGDAQTELRASMRWVIERLSERGIDP